MEVPIVKYLLINYKIQFSSSKSLDKLNKITSYEKFNVNNLKLNLDLGILFKINVFLRDKMI